MENKIKMADINPISVGLLNVDGLNNAIKTQFVREDSKQDPTLVCRRHTLNGMLIKNGKRYNMQTANIRKYQMVLLSYKQDFKTKNASSDIDSYFH